MYLWNTNKLAQDIKDNVITQNEEKKYYILSTILILLGFFVLEQAEPVHILQSVISYSLIFIVTFFYLDLNLKTNKGELGKNFIGRVLMLGIPLGIKFGLLSLISVIVLGIVFVLIFGDENGMNYALYGSSFISVVITAAIYHRINYHLKFINS